MDALSIALLTEFPLEVVLCVLEDVSLVRKYLVRSGEVVHEVIRLDGSRCPGVVSVRLIAPRFVTHAMGEGGACCQGPRSRRARE